MVRYLISIALILGGIIASTFLAGGNIMAFFDIPSFLLVAVVPFLFVSVLFGFKDMAAAFSSALKKEIDQDSLKKALIFFRAYGKAVWITGIVGVVIGVVGMLTNLEDVSAIGPNVALSILSIYCSCIAFLVIVLPFTVIIKKRLNGSCKNI